MHSLAPFSDCIPASWVAHVAETTYQHKFIHYPLVRKLLKIDLYHLTRMITEKLPTLQASQQADLMNGFNQLLNQWKVKDLNQHQAIVQNSLYNQEHIFTKLPLELLEHIMSFLPPFDLFRLRACKTLLYLTECQSSLHDFRIKRIISQSNTTFIDIFKHLEEYGSLIHTINFKSFNPEINQENLNFIIKKCFNLRNLTLNNTAPINLNSLIDLEHLETLKLKNFCQVFDHHLDFLQSLKNLQIVKLMHFGVLTGKGIHYLKFSSQLKALKISWNLIDNAGLQNFQSFNYLKKLNLTGNYRITNKGLKSLSALTQLVSLNLRACAKITDQGLIYLQPLICLRFLDIRENYRITFQRNEVIHFLSQIKALKTDSCFYTPSVIEQIKVLKQISFNPLTNSPII